MSFVLNPQTSRMVKVGGKKWRELIKQGMIENSPVKTLPATVLHEAKDENEAKVIKNILSRPEEEITKKIGMKKNTYAVRRGNKVLEFRNRPRQEEIANFTAESASRTIHKHMDQLSGDLEDAYENGDDEELGDFEHKLKELILQEMVSSNIHEKPTTGGNGIAPTRIKINKRNDDGDLTEYELGDFDVGENYEGEDY